MDGLVQAIILAVVIGGCVLGVIIGIVKTIGIEYRKTSKYASDSIGKALESIPQIAKETLELMDKYQEEKKEKQLRQAWEEEKRKNPTMSCKDEPNWGIM